MKPLLAALYRIVQSRQKIYLVYPPLQPLKRECDLKHFMSTYNFEKTTKAIFSMRYITFEQKQKITMQRISF